MSLKLYTTTFDPNSVESIQTEDEEILMTAGEDREAIAISLQELFDAAINSATSNIKVESSLTVEVTGSITIKGRGGVALGLLNIGGEAGTTETMKVSLTTQIKPK